MAMLNNHRVKTICLPIFGTKDGVKLGQIMKHAEDSCVRLAGLPSKLALWLATELAKFLPFRGGVQNPSYASVSVYIYIMLYTYDIISYIYKHIHT